jgi:uncharacterized protein (DUF849 family)
MQWAFAPATATRLGSVEEGFMDRKTIITCALTGGTPLPKHHHNIPKWPKEIADQGLAAAPAGAAVLHIHVRDPETGAPSTRLDYFEEVILRIRAQNREVLINLTTGFGAVYIPTVGDIRRPAEGTDVMEAAERVRHVVALKPEICTLDLNTMEVSGIVVMNLERVAGEIARAAREAGVRPEIEIFNAGDMVLAHRLVETGVVEARGPWSLVLGLKYGFPATADAMMYGRSQLPPGAVWTGFGISTGQFPMVAQSWILGGHCRVGMEDNIYLSHGELAPDNASLVKRARSILELMGASIATPAEARSIMGLPH